MALDEKTKIKSAVVRSLTNYATAARASPMAADVRSGAVPADALDGQTLSGRFTHRETIETYFSFLKEFLTIAFVVLSYEEAENIWINLVDKSPTPHDKERALRWFIDTIGADDHTCDLDAKGRARLFTNHIMKAEPLQLSANGLLCFIRYFLQVNSSTGLQHSAPRLRLRTSNNLEVEAVFDFRLEGLDYLWQVSRLHRDEDVAGLAVQALCQLFAHADPSIDSKRLFELANDMLNWITGPLRQLESNQPVCYSSLAQK